MLHPWAQAERSQRWESLTEDDLGLDALLGVASPGEGGTDFGVCVALEDEELGVTNGTSLTGS